MSSTESTQGVVLPDFSSDLSGDGGSLFSVDNQTPEYFSKNPEETGLTFQVLNFISQNRLLLALLVMVAAGSVYSSIFSNTGKETGVLPENSEGGIDLAALGIDTNPAKSDAPVAFFDSGICAVPASLACQSSQKFQDAIKILSDLESDSRKISQKNEKTERAIVIADQNIQSALERLEEIRRKIDETANGNQKFGDIRERLSDWRGEHSTLGGEFDELGAPFKKETTGDVQKSMQNIRDLSDGLGNMQEKYADLLKRLGQAITDGEEIVDILALSAYLSEVVENLPAQSYRPIKEDLIYQNLKDKSVKISSILKGGSNMSLADISEIQQIAMQLEQSATHFYSFDNCLYYTKRGLQGGLGYFGLASGEIGYQSFLNKMAPETNAVKYLLGAVAGSFVLYSGYYLNHKKFITDSQEKWLMCAAAVAIIGGVMAWHRVDQLPQVQAMGTWISNNLPELPPVFRGTYATWVAAISSLVSLRNINSKPPEDKKELKMLQDMVKETQKTMQIMQETMQIMQKTMQKTNMPALNSSSSAFFQGENSPFAGSSSFNGGYHFISKGHA